MISKIQNGPGLLWQFKMMIALLKRNFCSYIKVLQDIFIFISLTNVGHFLNITLSGAADYPSFRGLLKQLVGPLTTQLSDRRSSIVKQVYYISFSTNTSHIDFFPFKNASIYINLMIFFFCSPFLVLFALLQACHLLCFLSKELLGDFEACAEMFIPVSLTLFFDRL